jgi:hypothetical protein
VPFLKYLPGFDVLGSFLPKAVIRAAKSPVAVAGFGV